MPSVARCRNFYTRQSDYVEYASLAANHLRNGRAARNCTHTHTAKTAPRILWHARRTGSAGRISSDSFTRPITEVTKFFKSTNNNNGRCARPCAMRAPSYPPAGRQLERSRRVEELFSRATARRPYCVTTRPSYVV